MDSLSSVRNKSSSKVQRGGIQTPSPLVSSGSQHHLNKTDVTRVLLPDDYFSDVNPRTMRRLLNVVHVMGKQTNKHTLLTQNTNTGDFRLKICRPVLIFLQLLFPLSSF